MLDPIKHVVLLMLENHSFDQMLGCMKGIYSDLEGVDPKQPGKNMDGAVACFQTPTDARHMDLDPKHEYENVMEQIKNNNSGFVSNFAAKMPKSTAAQRKQIMQYYELDHLPALHALAREFTICDHWFSSMPGPTWPNRIFALSGTCNGRVDMPDGLEHLDLSALGAYDQNTIFDRLNEARKSWKVYFHDVPLSLTLTHQRKLNNVFRYHHISEFFRDLTGSPQTFPEFSFIEPCYQMYNQNDDHPPHDIMRAQKLIADVYNAIRSSPIWDSTLFVLLYDEHGGFYDHLVPPTSVTPPDGKTDASNFRFDQYGIRVPALLISPWVQKGVLATQFDHTSLLKYLTTKWNLGALGDRTRSANSFEAAFVSEKRVDTLSKIVLDVTQLFPQNLEMEARAVDWTSGHQSGMDAFMLALKSTPEARYITPALNEIQTYGKVSDGLKAALRDANDSVAQLSDNAFVAFANIKALLKKP